MDHLLPDAAAGNRRGAHEAAPSPLVRTCKREGGEPSWRIYRLKLIRLLLRRLNLSYSIFMQIPKGGWISSDMLKQRMKMGDGIEDVLPFFAKIL